MACERSAAERRVTVWWETTMPPVFGKEDWPRSFGDHGYHGAYECRRLFFPLRGETPVFLLRDTDVRGRLLAGRLGDTDRVCAAARKLRPALSD
jgi:hypothetical protein